MKISKLLEQLNEAQEINKELEMEIHKSNSEESDAVAKYLDRAEKAKDLNNVELEKLFTELAQDEQIHLACLNAALKHFALDNPALIDQGVEEFAEIIA